VGKGRKAFNSLLTDGVRRSTEGKGLINLPRQVKKVISVEMGVGGVNEMCHTLILLTTFTATDEGERKRMLPTFLCWKKHLSQNNRRLLKISTRKAKG